MTTGWKGDSLNLFYKKNYEDDHDDDDDDHDDDDDYDDKLNVMEGSWQCNTPSRQYGCRCHQMQVFNTRSSKGPKYYVIL